jgi:hypothetical protein
MRPKSHFTSALSLLIIMTMIWYAFHSQTPSPQVKEGLSLTEWSTARALKHVNAISKKPHYVGSEGHAEVRAYIVRELEKLELSVQTQEGYTLDPFGNLAKPTNIISRIKGSDPDAKALLIMSHYDSDPHSSLGASDAASGVATILEGVRAFIAMHQTPKNDIIICITDSEELGLNGAELFVNEHPWARRVGMVLNFEARGSGGPSYMLVETNGGNRRIIEEFSKAGVEYPVASSLAYSIYKMLPNSTDLTVFREDGDINGLNFAFIGDHYDYHTSLDTYERLDRNSLAHQGSYLMPLMMHFSNDMMKNGLKTEAGDDLVFFSLPFLNMISFPFSASAILIIAGGFLLLFLIILGIRKSRMNPKDLLIGFIPFLGSMVISFLVINYGFKSIAGDAFYLDKGSVFPYNGYWWVAAAALFSISLSFFLYHRFYHRDHIASLSVAPLFVLWIICLLICFPVGDGGIIPGVFLPGAGFFLVPFFLGLIMVWLNIYQKRPSYLLLIILATPAIFIFAPFVKAFPVALGMSILFVAGILSVLLFGLLIPILGHYRKKHVLATVSSLICVGFVVTAFAKAEFSSIQPQSTSLVYIADLDAQTAQWATYDQTLTPWTMKKMGESPLDPSALNKNTIDSKYANRFRYSNPADFVLLDSLKIETWSDSITNGNRTVKLKISSTSTINRMEVFCDTTYKFTAATVNGVQVKDLENTGTVFNNRGGNRMLSYYVTGNEAMELELTFDSSTVPKLQFYAASFDLLENKKLNVQARPENQISKPFVLNDAIIRKRTLLMSDGIAPLKLVIKDEGK